MSRELLFKHFETEYPYLTSILYVYADTNSLSRERVLQDVLSEITKKIVIKKTQDPLVYRNGLERT